jgi:hypothetical protein
MQNSSEDQRRMIGLASETTLHAAIVIFSAKGRPAVRAARSDQRRAPSIIRRERGLHKRAAGDAVQDKGGPDGHSWPFSALAVQARAEPQVYDTTAPPTDANARHFRGRQATEGVPDGSQRAGDVGGKPLFLSGPSSGFGNHDRAAYPRTTFCSSSIVTITTESFAPERS